MYLDTITMKEEIARQILQLEEARKHVLADAHHYSAIIPGILPIIGASAPLDVRRWGADFLAEGFASPALATATKETLSVKVLPLLREWLDSQGQDDAIVKSAIQTVASIYPLVLRYMCVCPVFVATRCPRFVGSCMPMTACHDASFLTKAMCTESKTTTIRNHGT